VVTLRTAPNPTTRESLGRNPENGRLVIRPLVGNEENPLPIISVTGPVLCSQRTRDRQITPSQE